MFQRNIPNWESLEFGISCMNSTFMFMVELGEAGCHFSTSRSRCGDDYKWSCCFDVIIFSITFIANDKRNIAWIAINGVENIYFDAEFFQFLFEINSSRLTGKLCDCNASDIKSTLLKNFSKTQYISIISNTKVTTNFIFFNISSTDYNDNFCMVG